MLEQLFQLFFRYIRRRLPLYVGIIFLFIMGIVFGSLAVQALSESQRLDLSAYLSGFYDSRHSNLFFGQQWIVGQGLIDNIVKSCGLLWLLGLTIIGAPLILIIIFLRGFVVGFTVGFFIENLFLKGIVVAIAWILPHNLMAIPAVILAGGAAFSFASTSFKTLIGWSAENIYNQFIICTIMMLLSGGLLTLGTLVEIYITPIFIDLTSGLLA